MKKAYAAPVLTVYGDVVDMTQGLGTGTGSDTAYPLPPRGTVGFKGPGALSGKK